MSLLDVLRPATPPEPSEVRTVRFSTPEDAVPLPWALTPQGKWQARNRERRNARERARRAAKR
jgi:hypothetical protein